MEKDIRILVVDDHQVMREGLGRMLGGEEDMEVVGQGAGSEEVLSLLETLSPNIILMDIKMPGVDGIELTRRVKQKHPSSNVIVLTLYDQYLTQAMEAGASGYLLKDIKRQELTEAIRQVHHGEVAISEDITSQMRNEYEERRNNKVVEGSGIMIEELQLVLLPPVDAKQLMRFAGRAEQTLECHVMQVVGSWHEGTVMTVVLDKAIALADILNRLAGMWEIETVGQKPLTGQISPGLLKKVTAIPKLRNRTSETIFVTFEKD